MEMKDILKQHSDAIDKTVEGFGEKLHTAVEKVKGMEPRLFDIEQKMSRRGGGSGAAIEHKTLGDAAIEAAGFKDFGTEAGRHQMQGRLRIETKAILTSGATSAGPAAGNPYLDTIVALPKRSLIVRSLLPTIPITKGQVIYPKMSARNNNAAMVAEGAPKPQSDFALVMDSLTVQKIAHYIKASMEILDDAPQLKGLIDTELLYGLAYVEDTQLLLGDGTGVNLTGLVPNATAYAAPYALTGTITLLDELGSGLLQCALANYSPDGIVLHPVDWWKIRLLKDTQGKYLLGDPGDAVEPRIFGLPVVATQAMPQGHFLIGEYAVAATLYDRMMATILMSTEDGNNFTTNQVTILAEERLALAVKQGAALIYGAFT